MIETLTNQGDSLPYYVLLVLVVLLTYWEKLSPRRQLTKPIRIRWARNFGLFLTGNFLAILVVPFFGLEAARSATAADAGLFNYLGVPLWLNVLAGVIILDLPRYGLHWASHRYKILWRLHRLHHTDQEFDYTTSLRFHPLELLLITSFTVALIGVLGLHPLTVICFEVVALAVNTLNHSNLRIAPKLDQVLRLFVITPDMHRIHHSSLPREFNSNLGGLFPWWDWAFKTYVPQPRDGHTNMEIGLRGYADDQINFPQLLLDPFISSATEFKSEAVSKTEQPV
jgi:sterol desaturase/sphingolipid hydroxylase (fatty acid hydroxylase superfamily)